VLDEDGGRHVAGKAVFYSEVVDLLKVLHEWFLEEEIVVWPHAQAHFFLDFTHTGMSLSVSLGLVGNTWHVMWLMCHVAVALHLQIHWLSL